MHIYWRMFEELKNMGEILVFQDPSLRRNFDIWLQRHASAIAMSYGYMPGTPRSRASREKDQNLH